MMLISKNPFVWHPSAHTITTPVVSMKIKDSNRNPVEVKNLKQPVRIQISNKGQIIGVVKTYLQFFILSLFYIISQFLNQFLIYVCNF